MLATPTLDLYSAALRADATALMSRLGFDDRFGRKRLPDLIDGCYITELMVIVQLVRWHEIGLVKPYEIDVPHPAALMVDLRRRITVSPQEYLPSFIMHDVSDRMQAWWSENTVTTAWRTLKAHVRIAEPVDDLCDAVADFLWSVRDVLAANAGDGGVRKEGSQQ